MFNRGGPEFKPRIADRRDVDGEQWGIVDVRPDAHMFYWFYYTTHEDGYLNRPLVLWLQGGPGGSSTGYGNFGIIGPINQSLEPNEATWVQSANVLFTDNPVGAGFSWCDNEDAFTRDGHEIADDMSTFLKTFLAANPELQNNEFYIFGQSYGGKMAATIMRRLYNDVQQGELSLNLKGFAMGNAWTHPLDSTLTWGGLLYWMSAVDENGLNAINDVARLAEQAAHNGDWYESTRYWRLTQQVLWQRTNYIDFYNILNYITFNKYERTYKQHNRHGHKYDLILGPMEEWDLYDLMNGPIREKLEIIPEDVIWDGQSDDVFYFQEGDFMKDVLDDVDWLLNNTDLHVITYQGQLDLICDTKGSLDWVQRLQWPGLPHYNAATVRAFVEPNDGQTDTYVKAYDKFKFYWNLRAGHAVPADMPDAALRMLNRILDDLDN